MTAVDDVLPKEYDQSPKNEWACRLYRYYTEDGSLLYIGIATDVSQRDLAHWKNSAWRYRAAYILVENYPSRRVAEVAEAQAIADENPTENRKWPTPRWNSYRCVPYQWWLDGRQGYRGDSPTWGSLLHDLPYVPPQALDEPPSLIPADLSLLARLEAQRVHDARRRRA